MLLPACTGTGLGVFVIERFAELPTTSVAVALLFAMFGSTVVDATESVSVIVVPTATLVLTLTTKEKLAGASRHRRRICTLQGRQNAGPSGRASQRDRSRVGGQRLREYGRRCCNRAPVGHSLRISDVASRSHRIRRGGVCHAKVSLGGRSNCDLHRGGVVGEVRVARCGSSCVRIGDDRSRSRAGSYLVNCRDRCGRARHDA